MRSSLHNRGLTLIETIVMIGIFTLAMGALVSALIYFYRSNAYSVEQSSAITSARRGVETMVEDIREATYAENGTFPVAYMGDYEMAVYSDVDHDDDIEKVRFFMDSNSLKRTVTKPTDTEPITYTGTTTTSTLSNNVRNAVNNVPIFTYHNAAGNTITDFDDLDAAASVDVNLIVNIDPSRRPQDYALRSSATLRNVNRGQ